MQVHYGAGGRARGHAALFKCQAADAQRNARRGFGGWCCGGRGAALRKQLGQHAARLVVVTHRAAVNLRSKTRLGRRAVFLGG